MLAWLAASSLLMLPSALKGKGGSEIYSDVEAMTA